MRKKVQQWSVMRFKASPAVFVGVVFYAPDEKAVLKQAVKQFAIGAEDQIILSQSRERDHSGHDPGIGGRCVDEAKRPHCPSSDS